MPTDMVYVLDENGIPVPKPEDPVMAAPKTTSKPKAKTASKPKKRTGLPRWTDSEVEMLMSAVASSKSNLEAFRSIADETGRSVGTIQQKYYALKKKTGTSVPNRAGRRSQLSQGSANGVSGMDTDALVALVTEAHAELRRRQEQLQRAMQEIAG